MIPKRHYEQGAKLALCLENFQSWDKEADMPAVPSPFRPRKPKVEPPHLRSKSSVERAIEHCRVFVDGEALPGELRILL